MNIISKESLSKMSIQQLEGALMQAKEDFKAASTRLSEERQKQILKTKAIRGKASKRKQELISQIMNINRATQKIHAQIERISYGKMQKFEAKKWSASQKVKARKYELKSTGTYKTTMTDEEKVLAWCADMDISEETLEALLELYTMKELANMSGDEFYDRAQYAEYSQTEHDYETFEPGEEKGGLTDLGIEDLGD